MYNYFIGTRIIKNAYRCIAITELEKKDFLEHSISESRIVIIPNGIDADEFQPNRSAGSAFRRRFELTDIPFVLYMGRLNLIKGPDLLLKAYEKLLPEFPGLHLVFAGTDEGLGVELKREIDQESIGDRVHLIGYIGGEDKVAAYAEAELLAVPSRREAMSIVALEAGACGTPVLLTTGCGFDEVKEAGCEVVSPDVLELYGGMRRMLSSSEGLRRAGGNLREIVLGRYTWQKTAQAYLRLSSTSVKSSE